MKRSLIAVASVASVVGACLPGPDADAAVLPPCEEGCIEGLCTASYPEPLAPWTDANLPLLRELSDDCTPVELDDQGRATKYLCFGVVPTFVIYDDESDRPALISQTERIELGTIEQTLEVRFGWSEGRLVHEDLRVLHDGVLIVNSLSWDWLYEADALVQIDAYTRFPEEDGPEESGNHSSAQFTNDDVERAHEIHRWDAGGRLLRYELRGGVDDAIFMEADYHWADDGRFLGSTTRRDGDVFDVVLEYDEAGAVTGFNEAGNEWVVSVACCGSCVATGS